MPKAKRHQDNVIVGDQGRIVIPARFRRELGLQPGDELMVRVKDGQLILEALDHALTRIQSRIVAAGPGQSGVAELIQERLREARKERAEIEAHHSIRQGQAS